MRVIPKDTKLRATVYKNFTIWDIFVAIGVIGIEVLIGFSNLPGKVWIMLVAGVVMAPLFFPTDDGGRFYQNIVSMIQFRFMKKAYAGAEIKRFVPYKEIRDDGIIVYPDYFARVISVGQTEFRLLDEGMQNTKIAYFERVLKLTDIGASMDIVKIDRPINFDAFSASLFERVEQEKNELKKAVLEDRISQIDRLNNETKQFRPYYYIVLYDAKEDSLKDNVDNAVQMLNQMGLESAPLGQKEVVNFLKYCHTRFFDEREIDNVEPKDYVDYIMPKKLKFAGKNYTVDDVKAFTMTISDYQIGRAHV